MAEILANKGLREMPVFAKSVELCKMIFYENVCMATPKGLRAVSSAAAAFQHMGMNNYGLSLIK
ncbi:hypothetical protein [Deminuibacter soli]|uniref:hypothetical protein n=1 Tax=Deminuibacter soli TaxID=2291815 RepID=UPI0011C1702D|nr:hypothetical protein [Deminuibacter soli]